MGDTLFNNKEIYTITKLSEQIWAIQERNVRMFLIEGSANALLIDTGYGSGTISSLVRELTKKPLMVVNTHADLDHIGGNEQFTSAYMHPAEFDRLFLRTNPSYSLLPLWENDYINIGDFLFQVLLFPGHTPGSIALIERKRKILFAGDLVQNEPVYLFGPGRNVHAYLASLSKLEHLQDEFDIIYSSHGSISPEKKTISNLKQAATMFLKNQLRAEPLPESLSQFNGMCQLYKYQTAGFLA